MLLSCMALCFFCERETSFVKVVELVRVSRARAVHGSQFRTGVFLFYLQSEVVRPSCARRPFSVGCRQSVFFFL